MEAFDAVEAQIQTISDLTATLAMFYGAGEASLAAGVTLHRDFATLRRDYAALEETHCLELAVMQSDEEEYRSVEQRCTALEARIEAAAKEKTIAEEKLAFEAEEKAIIQREHATLLECYRFEKEERMRVAERWSAAELRHVADVEERIRAEEKFAELEEERRRELEAVDEKHRLELRSFEKKCEELEKRNEESEAEKRLEVEASGKAEKECVEIWEEHKSELLEMVKEVELKNGNLVKEYEELVAKRDFDLLEKITIEEERKEAVEKYRVEVTERGKVEEKCKQLAEKLDREMAGMIMKEKECKEVADKYRKLKNENEGLEKNYRDALMAILEEQSELHEKHRFEQKEKLKLKRECDELKEKIEGLLSVDKAQESKGLGNEKAMFDKKYGELQEKYEFARLENLNLREEFEEFGMVLEGFKKEIIGNVGRNDTLIKDAKNGKKAENVEIQLPMPVKEVFPRNGGLHASGAPKLSSGGLILVSDSDDDCAVVEKKQTGLKRKQGSSSTANEMKQYQKLRRCDHSVVNRFSENVASSAIIEH